MSAGEFNGDGDGLAADLCLINALLELDDMAQRRYGFLSGEHFIVCGAMLALGQARFGAGGVHGRIDYDGMAFGPFGVFIHVGCLQRLAAIETFAAGVAGTAGLVGVRIDVGVKRFIGNAHGVGLDVLVQADALFIPVHILWVLYETGQHQSANRADRASVLHEPSLHLRVARPATSSG